MIYSRRANANAPLAACGLLPAACRLPPAACRLLPAACCLLPAACCLLPATCCLLPAACCLLRPIAHAALALNLSLHLSPSQDQDDVFLLTGGSKTIYVWVGPTCSAAETEKALEVANHYAASQKVDRASNAAAAAALTT